MGILVRVLEFFSGIAVAFAGYFVMAAQGWPEPLQSMTIEREVLGGLIAVLGLALVWSAFKPKSRPPSAARAKAVASAHYAPLNFTAEPAAAPGPDVAAAPVLAPVAPTPSLAPAPAPEQTTRSGELAALLAEGDRLFAEGRTDEALDPYSHALDLARQAHAANPQDTQAARALAGALKSNADVYDEEGRLDTAIDLYEEALKLNRGMADAGSAADRRSLSLVLERLGDCRESRGHRSRAADLYRESLGIAESLAQSDPDNSLYAEDLAVTRRRLAELEGENIPA